MNGSTFFSNIGVNSNFELVSQNFEEETFSDQSNSHPFSAGYEGISSMAQSNYVGRGQFNPDRISESSSSNNSRLLFLLSFEADNRRPSNAEQQPFTERSEGTLNESFTEASLVSGLLNEGLSLSTHSDVVMIRDLGNHFNPGEADSFDTDNRNSPVLAIFLRSITLQSHGRSDIHLVQANSNAPIDAYREFNTFSRGESNNPVPATLQNSISIQPVEERRSLQQAEESNNNDLHRTIPSIENQSREVVSMPIVRQKTIIDCCC